MKKLFAAFSLMLAVSTLAAQDVYIKSKNHTDAMSFAGQNQPASDTFTEQWISEGKAVSVTPSNTAILDFDKNVVYIINHKSKSYVEASLPLNASSLMPPEMAPQLQNMKMTATVTPTGKKKTIGTKSCDEYTMIMSINMGFNKVSMNTTVYATTDVPLDVKNYAEKIQANLLKLQMFGLDDASVKELSKIQGVWIASDTTTETMGAKAHTTMEVVELAQKPAPAGIYVVPAGYVKQAKLTMQDMQGR
jgi:hypothetical protein